MGSAQSSRVISFSNDEEDSIITVSDDIVHRLLKTAESNPPRPAKNTNDPPPIPPTPLPSTQSAIYYPEFTISALQMQQQKEQELKNLDSYWQKRLNKLEKDHRNIDRIIQEEYARALNELSAEEAGHKSKTANMVQPCLAKSEKVLKCYHEHPKEVLRCSSLVEEFSNCVDQRRARVIMSRC